MKRPAFFVLACLAAALFAALIAPRIFHLLELQKRSDALNAEILKLKKENLALENKVRLLREDPVYIERVARRKFNKAKEGEIVYKLVPADQASSS